MRSVRRFRDTASRPRILVIDDDQNICEIVRQVLSDEGYAVATVPNGAAALDLAALYQPAVIFLDLRTPLMDGWSFAEQYRRQSKPLAPLILFTASTDVEEIAKRIGAAAFVRKPFDLDDLVRAIEGCLAAT